MTKKIFRSICLVALAVLIASVVLIMGVLYGYGDRAELEGAGAEMIAETPEEVCGLIL